MFPLLTYPLALIGLATLPALAAIYLLRNRFRRRPVSSVMLWQLQAQSKDGGSKVERMRLPLVFFLELLALTLLTVAATGPRWQLPQTARPLVVVLDDSQSMLAVAGAKTPRTRAEDALALLMKRRAFLSVRLVLAGAEARVLGPPVTTWNEVRDLLTQWRCQAPAAALEAGIALAADLGRQKADLLVLTDHAPASDPAEGRLQWWAHGQPEPNLGFVNASRTVHGEEDRVLIEVANYSAAARNADLQIQTGGQLLRGTPLSLAPNTRQKLTLTLPANAPALEATLGADALAADNRLTLLPAPRRRVRVQTSIEDEALRALVVRTVAATGLRSSVTADPELVIHTGRGAPPGTNAWGLRLVVAPEPTTFSGPFVVDTAHPLTRGLELEGVIWAAGVVAMPPGHLPIITAGNDPLLLAQTDALGRQQLTLHLTPDRSTLATTPNWPILFWNLLTWRARETPGLVEVNHRLGSDVPFKSAGGPVRVTRPDLTVQELAATSDRVLIETAMPGLYSVVSGGATNTFAVNLLAPEESDLSAAATGRWGQWAAEKETRAEYTAVLWLFVLAGLLVLGAHLFVLTHAKGAA